MEKNNSKQKLNRWLVFTTMPFQMGATIYLFYWLGTWLDREFVVEGEWWTKALTMLGVMISLVQFIRQANRISKHD